MKRLGINRKQGSKICLLSIVAALMLAFFVGAASASGGGDEHGGTKGWIATDTYRVMNFTILAVALFFLLRKPASQALDARIKGIKDHLGDLEIKKKDAEKELAGYKDKLRQLDQETEKIVSEYVRQGKDAKERILKGAEAAAEKLQEQAQRNIDQEFKQAKLRLQEDILEKALSRAEDIVRRKITDNDQNRLVDEYLKKVVA